MKLDTLIDYDEFDYQIRQRGKDYYNKGKVRNVIKSGNVYRATVSGSYNNTYNVTINLEDDYDIDFLDYECDCPCEFPCKHIYAVMLCIEAGEYTEVDLMPEVRKATKTIDEIVKEIPAEDLKKYILNELGKEYVCFEVNSFEKYFSKYYPDQEYSYYYNNLYNALVIEGYKHDLLNDYLTNSKELMNALKYNEVFEICMAIIEAANDTGHINSWNELIDSFPILGMNLRIIYRKANKSLKKKMDAWINVLKDNNYYDSLYLEDIVLMIKIKSGGLNEF